MDQARGRDIEAAHGDHMPLDCHIIYVIVLHAGRRFHLNHTPATPPNTLKNINPNQNSLVPERRLKNSGDLVIGKQPLGFIECRAELVMAVGRGDATRRGLRRQ